MVLLATEQPFPLLGTSVPEPLIRPSFDMTLDSCSSFENYLIFTQKHIQNMLPFEVLNGLRQAENFQQAHVCCLKLNETLPLVTWELPKQFPSTASISFLCHAAFTHGAGRHISDTLSRWLVPGKFLGISFANSFTFQFTSYPRTDYFFHQVLVEIENEKDFLIIKNNIQEATTQLRLNILAVRHARNVMSLKKLSSDQKLAFIQDHFSSVFDRPSKEFDHDIFEQIQHVLIKLHAEDKLMQLKEKFAPYLEHRTKIFDRDLFNEIQHFLLLFRDKFTAIRDLRHIGKLISLQYLFRKALQRQIGLSPDKRHLSLKLLKMKLHFPTGKKTALGILVGINVLNENELFEEKHIFEAICHCIPSVQKIKDSYIADQRGHDKVRLLYLEVEKKGEIPFTLEETKILTKKLPKEIKAHIENVTHPIFMPRNEEEIMRNIVILSQELKYTKDIPQVIISFNAQLQHELSFTVVLLRILKPTDLPLKELFRQQKSYLKLHDHEAKCVGRLRNKYSKEANVFHVKLDKKSFIRKDYSLDLFKARQIVSAELGRILGEMRDFNGGILSKQHEVFQELRKLLGPTHEINDFLLENFFYSLTPSLQQSMLLPSSLKTLFLILLEALESSFEGCRFICRAHHDGEYLLLLISSPLSCFKEEVFNALHRLKISSFDLISTFVSSDEMFCLGYLYRCQDPHLCSFFQKTVQDALNIWEKDLL